MAPGSYSHYLSCVHDERNPIGCLGRGTHYSIFRCAEWYDVYRRRASKAELHDFAVIWDEDHDTRVIDVVERLYLEGFLSPILFVGERKGTLTVILDARFLAKSDADDLSAYCARVSELAEAGDGDSWSVQFGSYSRLLASKRRIELCALIHASEERAQIYVQNIDSLWNLGVRPTGEPCAQE